MDRDAYVRGDLLVTLEKILNDLVGFHRSSMENITEGHPGEWDRHPKAVSINEKVYQSVELLESAKKTLEDFYKEKKFKSL